MHSRRDQVEAHAFVSNRLKSALLQAEPDAVKVPLRRTPIALVCGAALGALVVAVVAVVSLFKPATSAAWRQPGALVVEKQTGTRYVFLEGRLRPVLNYASARLLLGGKMTVLTASTKSLLGVPRGGQVGILGAPDSLPDPARAGDQPWLVCAGSQEDPRGVLQPTVSLLVGNAMGAGAPGDEAALVRTPDEALHLVSGGRRMRLTTSWAARALGLDDTRALRVRSSWADALPAGPDLGSMPLPERGAAGPVLDGHPSTVGQVMLVHGTGGLRDRHFLVMPGGVMPISETAVALAMADPATEAAYGDQAAQVIALSTGGLSSVAMLPAQPWAAQLPPMPRDLVNEQADAMPCVRVTVRDRVPAYGLVSVPVGAGSAAPPVAPELTRDALTADRVGLPRGGGVLARTLPGPRIQGAGLYLVVETGAKYPVDGEKAAAALGYSPAAAASVPAGLLAMLPTGPALHDLGGGGA